MMAADFWQFSIGNLLTIVGMAAGFLIWFLRYDQRLNHLEDVSAEISENNVKVSNLLDRINREGTQWSAQRLGIETELTKNNTYRINELEKFTKEYGPKIAAIATNVEWLTHHAKKDGINK